MSSPARGPGRPSRRSQPLREFRKRGNPQPDGHQFDRQRQPARLTADAARQRQLSRSRLSVTPAIAARAKNSVTASVTTGGSTSPGTAIGGTRHTHSGSMSSGIRLVTKSRRLAARPASWSQARRTDSSTCSQLSITSNDRQPDTAPATASSPAAAWPPGSPPPQPGRQPPGPRYDTAPSRRSTPAPPGPPTPRSRPPQPPQRSSPPRRRRPASPPHNGPAWPRSPRAPQLSRQTKTASAATAPPAGPSRHHHHGRRARRRPPPPADPIAVTGGQPGHPETPPAAGSARTSPADHQEEDQRPRIPAPNGRNADLYGAERPSQRAR